MDALDDVSETGESNEPEMSILPIPDSVGKNDEEVLQDVSDAILGRSDGEVVEALERAEGKGSDSSSSLGSAGQREILHEEL